jgi:hypothetical protein
MCILHAWNNYYCLSQRWTANGVSGQMWDPVAPRVEAELRLRHVTATARPQPMVVPTVPEVPAAVSSATLRHAVRGITSWFCL